MSIHQYINPRGRYLLALGYPAVPCNGGGDSPDTSGQNEAAKVNAEIAKDMWGEYKATYLPKERQFVDEAFDYDSPDRQDNEAGVANAAVQTQYAQARDRLARTPGLDPSSAQAMAGAQKMELAQAAQGANASNTARNRVQDIGYAHKQDAISIGKGLPGTATGAATAAANIYGGINQVEQNAQNSNSNNVAGVVGGGMAAASLYKDFAAADGGLVTKKKVRRLAFGGMAGNPAMAAAMKKNTDSANAIPASAAAPSDESQAVQVAKMANTGRKMYQAATAETPIAGTLAAEGSTVAGGASGGLGTGFAGTSAADIGASMGIAADGTIAAAGTEIAAGAATAGTAAAEAAALGTVASTAAAGTVPVAAAGASGALAAGAPALAAAGPVGWAIGAGLLVASLLKDGGEVKADTDDIEGRANGLDGGLVSGPGGPREDLVPAMLSNGEFVVNANSVKKIGKAKLIAMNNLGLPKHKRSAA